MSRRVSIKVGSLVLVFSLVSGVLVFVLSLLSGSLLSVLSLVSKSLEMVRCTCVLSRGSSRIGVQPGNAKGYKRSYHRWYRLSKASIFAIVELISMV